MLLVAALGGGCDDSKPVVDAASEVETLRSLPYAAYSRERADPGRAGVVHFDRERAYPGYNLYSNRDLCSADLFDMEGRVVRRWSHQPCHHWSNVELQPDGDLLVAGMEGVPGADEERREFLGARYLLRLSWEGEVVWKLRVPAHHDAELTPEGDLLTLTMAYRRIPAFDRRVDVRDNGLALVDPRGRLREEVSLYDLLAAAPPALFSLHKVGFKHKAGAEEYDPLHANSVEWMRDPALAARHPLYARDNVLVSIRHQDSIVALDWRRRRLVWSWGRGEVSGPHDATVLPGGTILVFDNGLARGWSRVVELDPLAERIVWEYRAENPTDFFTASRGANQRLTNGNTLITNSDSGQVFEVTPAGERVWEFLNPHLDSEGHRASIVRLRRYEPAFIEGLERRARAGARRSSGGAG